MLPVDDERFLQERGLKYATTTDANMLCISVTAYPLPEGYDHVEADLLIRLNPGYPDMQPDMWWFDPGIKLADGRTIRATDETQSFLGRNWQRWSRHLNTDDWRPGSDTLETYFALIDQELLRKTI